MKSFYYMLFLALFSLGFWACQPGWVPQPGNGNGGGPNGTPFSFVITPCQQSDSLGRDTLPQMALDHIANTYPEDTITNVTGYRLPTNATAFGVSLSGGQGLLFSADGELVGEADNIVVNLIAEDLPRPAINYLNREFPGWDTLNFSLTLEDSFGAGVIVFSLTDDEGEVLFSRDGEFLCRPRGRGHGNGGGNNDDDDNDDGDDRECDRGDLTGLVQPWLALNVGGFRIDDIECEDRCEDEPVIEVELDDTDTNYYFTTAGEFYYTQDEFAAAELPDAVLTTLSNTYPAYELDEEVYELNFADETVAYELEISTSTGDDIELVIDEAGNILCADD